MEFAIIAPAFVMMLVGTLCYGVYFATSHGVAQLAADTARAAISGLDDTERQSIARDHVTARAKDYPLIDPAKVSLNAGPSNDDPDQFRVEIRYNASALPIWTFENLVPLPSPIIARTASIKRGGF